MSNYYGDGLEKIGDRALRLIDTASGGSGYDWQTFGLLRDVESGQLYVTYDSGCSCSYFLDGSVTLSDLTPVASWQEAVEKCKEYVEETPDEWSYSYGIKPDELARFAERLMTERPEPSPVGVQS